MRQITTYSMLLLLCLLAGCRSDIPFLHSEEEQLQPVQHRHIRGFFLLNEGNMGSNKASLDFFDVGTGKYQRNIYPTRNPGIVKELGDVGNDIAIYGSKLYAVINCSHYVEVMDVHTGRHVGSIDVLNCRYIVFHDGKAYISSYAGPVQIDPNARPGKVVEVDTTSLKITREVVVGYQPEEMVITGGKLTSPTPAATAIRTTTRPSPWWTYGPSPWTTPSTSPSTCTGWRSTATGASTSRRAATTTM